MAASRQSAKFFLLLALLTMSALGPWITWGTPPGPLSLPSPPLRSAPVRPAPLPRASAGRNGPQANAPAVRPRPATPAPAPAPRPAPTAAQLAARQAARQRYLNNVYLLAKLIYGEARGESYIGQVAVGAVVMNRVQNPSFPKTLPGVIFEPGAFDAVIDGQMSLPPDAEAIKAAEAAIAGWDPTGGALYYYNPAKTTVYWIFNRPVLTVIGRHYFAS